MLSKTVLISLRLLTASSVVDAETQKNPLGSGASGSESKLIISNLWAIQELELI